MSDTEAAEVEDQTTQFEDDSSAEDIAEAKALGWKNPSEWKGAPPKNGFVKASEYVKRGETVIPIIKSQNAKLEKQLEAANKKLEDFKAEQAQTFENLSRMSKAALDRQRTQLEEKYSASIDLATEVGDKDAVRKLRKEEREALKEFDEAANEKPVKKEEKKADEIERNPVIDEWISDNSSWFNKNKTMTTYAITYQAELLQDGMSLAKSLAETQKEIERRFPEKFDDKKTEEDDDEKPKRKGSPVEGGGSRGGDGSSGRSAWSKIPEEAKKQGDRFIKEDKLFLNKGEDPEKDLQKARERYALQYLEIDK